MSSFWEPQSLALVGMLRCQHCRDLGNWGRSEVDGQQPHQANPIILLCLLERTQPWHFFTLLLALPRTLECANPGSTRTVNVSQENDARVRKKNELFVQTEECLARLLEGRDQYHSSCHLILKLYRISRSTSASGNPWQQD